MSKREILEEIRGVQRRLVNSTNPVEDSLGNISVLISLYESYIQATINEELGVSNGNHKD